MTYPWVKSWGLGTPDSNVETHSQHCFWVNWFRIKVVMSLAITSENSHWSKSRIMPKVYVFGLSRMPRALQSFTNKYVIDNADKSHVPAVKYGQLQREVAQLSENWWPSGFFRVAQCIKLPGTRGKEGSWLHHMASCCPLQYSYSLCSSARY